MQYGVEVGHFGVCNVGGLDAALGFEADEGFEIWEDFDVDLSKLISNQEDMDIIVLWLGSKTLAK